MLIFIQNQILVMTINELIKLDIGLLRYGSATDVIPEELTAHTDSPSYFERFVQAFAEPDFPQIAPVFPSTRFFAFHAFLDASKHFG
jgi:hypothetical protein